MTKQELAYVFRLVQARLEVSFVVTLIQTHSFRAFQGYSSKLLGRILLEMMESCGLEPLPIMELKLALRSIRSSNPLFGSLFLNPSSLDSSQQILRWG